VRSERIEAAHEDFEQPVAWRLALGRPALEHRLIDAPREVGEDGKLAVIALSQAASDTPASSAMSASPTFPNSRVARSAISASMMRSFGVAEGACRAVRPRAVFAPAGRLARAFRAMASFSLSTLRDRNSRTGSRRRRGAKPNPTAPASASLRPPPPS
jgi:hypothetical protein